MIRQVAKKVANYIGAKKRAKVLPLSDEQQQFNPKFQTTVVNYMDMLEQFWIEKPNNFQGPIIYETTFVQGGYTSFVTLPTGHCFANPKRCRSAENSRQLAARVALFHSMFGGDIFHDVTDESLDSTIEEIVQNQSVSNIKCDKDESMQTISYILSNSSRKFGAEHFQTILKLELMHWNGSFRKLANLRYSKKQISRELSHLSVEKLSEFMVLEWRAREQKLPGLISLELSRCQKELLTATHARRNVRLPKEKCLILVAAAL